MDLSSVTYISTRASAKFCVITVEYDKRAQKCGVVSHLPSLNQKPSECGKGPSHTHSDINYMERKIYSGKRKKDTLSVITGPYPGGFEGFERTP